MSQQQKQEENRITIHHYDDEPHNISSLRDNLLYLIMNIQPEWIHPDEIPSEDDESESFFLIIHRPEKPKLRIEYCIYPDAATFCDKAGTAGIASNDIVLLDAIERGKNGEPVEGVRKCLEMAKSKVPRDHLFLVSAFVSELKPELKQQFLKECIIRKPFDVNEMAKKLLLLAEVDLNET